MKFVVCPSCDSLYTYDDCLLNSSGRTLDKKCSYVKFPQHPQMSMRKPCGHNLLKKVVLSNGKTKYYPLKVYCYKKLKDLLFNLLNRPGMWQLCQHWKSRIVPPNSLADVYDGKVWKSFKGKDGSLFFKTAIYNIGLMLNCDWFPPFDRTQYSVGVMYAVVLNLPRAIRFKPENLLIIGIIPGPDEPTLVMNSYLKPMTDELFDLWEDGIVMEGSNSYAALICVACDRPAATKIGGFLVHSSSHACSYCCKKFLYIKEWKKIDSSGFTSYTKQNVLWLRAKTQAERNEIEQEHGSRFSQLSLLPYFDSSFTAGRCGFHC